MLARIVRPVVRSNFTAQVRNVSTKPNSQLSGVSTWEKAQLYGRSQKFYSDPIHGSHDKYPIGEMLYFAAAIGGTLVGGVLIMETCRKAPDA